MNHVLECWNNTDDNDDKDDGDFWQSFLNVFVNLESTVPQDLQNKMMSACSNSYLEMMLENTPTTVSSISSTCHQCGKKGIN